MQVQSLGQEDPLEKSMEIHSSILAWRIQWTKEPSGLQSIGSQRVRHEWSDLATHTHIAALECLANFCGTMMWISCMYTYIPTSWDLSSCPTTLRSHPSSFLALSHLPQRHLLYRFLHKALHEINHTPRAPSQAQFLGSGLKIITLRPLSKDGKKKKKKSLPFS